jgi:hypothetical protein
MMSSRQRVLLKTAREMPDADKDVIEKAAAVVRQGMHIDLPDGDPKSSNGVQTVEWRADH